MYYFLYSFLNFSRMSRRILQNVTISNVVRICVEIRGSREEKEADQQMKVPDFE